MKKRMISLCMVVALLLAMMPQIVLTADAAEVVESGTCGDNLKWILDDAGTLTISGTGAMDNYRSTSQIPWRKYTFDGTHHDKLTSIVIEDGVTHIGNMAFISGRGVRTVKISSTVESIGSSAFDGCIFLDNVIIPSSVKSIGSRAFNDCQRLERLVISDGVETIGEEAFLGCISLSTVTIPVSIKEIGEFAFGSYSFLPGELKDIYIYNRNCTIGDSGSGFTLGDPSMTVIHAPEGSDAETYAKRYGYAWENIIVENSTSQEQDATDKTKRLVQLNNYWDGEMDSTYLYYDDQTGLLERVKFSYDYESPDLVYEYDDEERLIKIEAGDIEEDFYSYFYLELIYDENGRFIKWKEFSPGLGNWEGDCIYDSQGRLVQTAGKWDAGHSEIIDFTYDESGLLLEAIQTQSWEDSEDYKDVTVTKYQYDGQNRVLSKTIIASYGTHVEKFIYSYHPFVIIQEGNDIEAYYDLGYLSNMNVHLAHSFYWAVYGPFSEGCELEKLEADDDGYLKVIEGTLNVGKDAVKSEFVWETVEITPSSLKSLSIEYDDDLEKRAKTAKINWGYPLFQEDARNIENSDPTSFAELVKISALLSNASYDLSDGGYLQQTLNQLGAENIEVMNSGALDISYPAHSISHVEFNQGDLQKNVVIVTIRGSSTAGDWITDFDAWASDFWNSPKEHPGFSLAKTRIKNEIKAYLSKNGIDASESKILITGHSYGAAVANLLANSLEDIFGQSNIYAYTFASPNNIVVDPSSMFEFLSAGNIHNFRNAWDPVVRIPVAPALLERYTIFGEQHFFTLNEIGDASEGADIFGNHNCTHYVNYAFNLVEQNSVDSLKTRCVQIHCPVDVTAYDENGDVIGQITDNQLNESSTTIMMYPVSDQKIIFIDQNEDVQLSIVATDTGTMDVIITEYDVVTGNVSGINEHLGVGLIEGKEFDINIANETVIADIALEVVDNEGNRLAIVNEDGTETMDIFENHKHATLLLVILLIMSFAGIIFCATFRKKRNRA